MIFFIYQSVKWKRFGFWAKNRYFRDKNVPILPDSESFFDSKWVFSWGFWWFLRCFFKKNKKKLKNAFWFSVKKQYVNFDFKKNAKKMQKNEKRCWHGYAKYVYGNNRFERDGLLLDWVKKKRVDARTVVSPLNTTNRVLCIEDITNIT